MAGLPHNRQHLEGRAKETIFPCYGPHWVHTGWKVRLLFRQNPPTHTLPNLPLRDVDPPRIDAGSGKDWGTDSLC